MARSILFIAFHYPPVQASSGLLRSLAFTRDLAAFGWDVGVITSSIFGEESVATNDNLRLIPNNVQVTRAKAFDAAKSFAVGGRYPGFLEWPDRYSSWAISATLAGYQQIRRNGADIIFSTYPIASAHLVGYFLSRLTKKPWVADFRDPMVMDDHPDTPLRRRAHAWVEKKTIERSQIVLVTNEHAKAHYLQKFPSVSKEKFVVIENGYDEEIFSMARDRLSTAGFRSSDSREIRILHSGALYPNHRNPAPLFQAISELSPGWQSSGLKIKFVFRGSGYDDHYLPLIERYGITSFVELAKPIPYIESIKEILASDGLLLIQGVSCNLQVPAKFYEYLKAGIPILALTDSAGATSSLAVRVGLKYCANDRYSDEIKQTIPRYLKAIQASSSNLDWSNAEVTSQFSRLNHSKQLHTVLNTL